MNVSLRIKGGGTVFSLLLLIMICTSACSNRTDGNEFDPDVFRTDKYNLVLCFDLRNEEKPIAGLTVRGGTKQVTPVNTGTQVTQQTDLDNQPVSQPLVQQHFVIVPFTSTSVQKNINLLTTWGSYTDFTVINYISNPRNMEAKGIGISPVFSTPPEPLPPAEELKGNVYLIRTGLQRRFIYRYPVKDQLSDRWPSELQHIPRDIIDAIGVAVPADAKGVEIRNNLTAIPNYEFDNGTSKFYPASAERANTNYLEIRYAVEASKGQKLAADIALELVAVLFTPLLELLLLNVVDIRKPGLRRAVIVIGLILQALVLGWLIWAAISISGEFAEKAISKVVVVVIGAVSTALVLLVKRNPHAANPSSTGTPPPDA